MPLMEFEWDAAKAAANLAKHGIDFADAMGVFDDPRMISIADPRGYGEPLPRRRHRRRAGSSCGVHDAGRHGTPPHQCEKGKSP
jgi:hypothetical protein